jgi:peroxiredoxin
MLRRTLALLCLAVACYGGTPRPLADIPIYSPDGKIIQLRQYRGKVLLLVIVLTDCKDCANTVELLNGLQKEYGKNLQVIAAAVNPDAPQQAAAFRAAHHLTYPVGFLTNENDIMTLADFKKPEHPLSPIYIFVDKKGMVRAQYNANDEFFFKKEEKNVRYLIEEYLKQ